MPKALLQIFKTLSYYRYLKRIYRYMQTGMRQNLNWIDKRLVFFIYPTYCEVIHFAAEVLLFDYRVLH